MATRTDAQRGALIVVRLGLIAISVVVLGWSLAVATAPEIKPAQVRLVNLMSLGETFEPDVYSPLRTPCDALTRNRHYRAAHLAALIAARDLELKLLDGSPEEIADLSRCASEATRHLLQTAPTFSYAWYLMAWTALTDGRDPALFDAYVERSVLMAPREAWMAFRRLNLMRTEIARGRSQIARSDYRALVEAELIGAAALLLKDCATRDPFCEQDWNAGIPPRNIDLVWRQLVRASDDASR